MIRTRFAPSPTGYLHVGGIRTALFAWLLARQSQGKFILRFEDTDKKREVAGSAEHLIECLRALGLDYDEGPDIGGPYAPYRQSERLDIYNSWARKLINAGRAYADPYTPEQVQQFRVLAQKNKKPFLYRKHRPSSPPVWDGTQPLRFQSDPRRYEGDEAIKDAVMGELSISPEVIDDFVLIKSDGYPTYNFAHIVDDAEMKVTHIIRGQEFLASIPNYINLYEALGINRPILATVPHVLGPDGKKKLSKRDGAKDVLDYIRQGFLPEALVNFIASMGWNDGTEQEIFSRQELMAKFSLDRVQSAGACFDEQRLLWMNGQYIRNLTLDELYKKVATYWSPEAATYSDEYKKSVLGLVQERLKYFAELAGLTNFFFIDLPLNPRLIADHKQLKNIPANDLKRLLICAQEALNRSDFSLPSLITTLNDLLVTTSQKPAILFSLIRIATTQAPASPPLAESLQLLGKEKSLDRIGAQIKNL